MQYNFPHFRIDRSDFLKGGDSYDGYPDGGMLFSSYGYNAFKAPGYLTQVPSFGLGTSIDSGLPTRIGISFGFGKGALSQEVIVVGANGDDGSFYTMNEATGALTKEGGDDTANNYVKGKTSTVFYHGKFYTTTEQDITENVVALTAASRYVSWWQTTNLQAPLDSSSPHPQVVFGDIHYIADGQYLHQNDNGTIQRNVLDLGVDWVITEMEVYNNLIYIAAEPYYNFSSTAHGFAKIFTWNGYSDSFLDEYLVDSRISAMKVFKNILYVFTRNYMGYFTGTIVKNLYPVSGQIYKCEIATTSDSMWFADGTTIIRYGSPYLTGRYSFHRYFSTVSSDIVGIVSPYFEALSIMTTGATNGSNYYVSDVNTIQSSGSTNNIIIFNPRIFTTPVKIRGAVIQLKNQLTSSQTIEIGYTDDQGNVNNQFLAGSTASMLQEMRWRFDFFSQQATRRVLPHVQIQSNPYIEWIDFLYEPSEDMLNK